MRKVLIIAIVYTSYICADVAMQKTVQIKPKIIPPRILPIERLLRPIHPVRPIVNTGVVYQDNYYNTNYTSSCQQYIDTLAQKDEEILALQNELEKLKNKEQEKLSQSLKKSYEAELEAFDSRRSSGVTKSSAIISSEPIK